MNTRLGEIIIDKKMVGIAAEFAVASELGRRNVYAQPTFGHLKRTDLLIIGENGRLLRIEVKGKQGYQWPNCKGIPNDQSILVLVDFQGKSDTQRPDFYILTFSDWKALMALCIAEVKRKAPNQVIEIDTDYVPVWLLKVNSRGQPYRGMGLSSNQVERFKEQWDKITKNHEDHTTRGL